ncbi:MAG: RecQ family ATP-dependent DNA helicase [Acidobacteria bacterium]|nr:MAG: RecQ family ATP-dependent DNA helicase [Acidobacteriota bacterium]
MDSFEANATRLLRDLTGSDQTRFRPGQLEAIREIVEERGRAIVVQRTGWGKSAVYLIATALLRSEGSGATVIVSPLLVLMRNQLEMAERVGLSAKTVNSANTAEWEEIFDAISRNEVDLLLISPERLNNPQFREEVMPKLFNRIGLLVIDEVHCISDWGHDFRPDYRRLQRVVGALPPNVPVLGTTATANDRVVADVAEQLGDDLKVIRGSLERDSLTLQVLEIPHMAERMAWLAQTIPQLPGSGIVYCLTVHDAERVGEWLRSCGIEAHSYTGEMDNEARLEIEQRLTGGALKVVVATSALAMGYDNPRIEFVIHFQTPGSPIAYYQQVGRAGRAVDKAYGLALSGWEDQDIQDWFISNAFPSQIDTETVLRNLARAEGSTIQEIEGGVNLRRSRILSMLKILEVEGAVFRQGSKWFRSAKKWVYPQDRIEAVTASRRAEQQAMKDYISTDRCLMEFLRRELDDKAAARCGRCANCLTPFFSADVDIHLTEKALSLLRSTQIEIAPRKQRPCDLGAELNLSDHSVEPGRCLVRWGDPGLAELVRSGKYDTGRFEDDLVEAMTGMIKAWSPTPSPTWLTFVPSSTDVVEDFAMRLAASLGIEVVESLRRIRLSQPQKTMENSCQQARNVLGAFEVVDHRPGPALLVDDMVDSRWTFTVVGSQLRGAGSGPVYPVALADTSRGGA